MIILDTDIVTLLMAGQAQITERIKQVGAVVLTIVSRIEVLQGRFAALLKAADAEQLLCAQHWLDQSEQFLQKFTIVPFDAAAVAVFDQLRVNKKLKKIGRADLLIVSIVLAQRGILVTRNRKHFEQVPGLKTENWAD